MGRVEGKVAIVTGGARGLGAAGARALVAEGAKVVIGDVLDEDGTALASELGENARYKHLDVTDGDQWAAAVAFAREAFGPVNVLVNNAGILLGGSITSFPLADWQKVLNVDLTGTFLGCQAIAQTMIDNKAGSIINVSSVAGFQGGPDTHAYTAAKFGVRGLTKSVGIELAPHGIRVNSIHPGLIQTPLLAAQKVPDDVGIPLDRVGDPKEVAALVVYLASDESSYSTASEFIVDGGLLAAVPGLGRQ